MNSSPLSKKELLKVRIKKAATDGRITCAILRKIAEEVNANYKEAGKTADELRIKIMDCDLGCF
jgi:RNA-binding protein YhbY